MIYMRATLIPSLLEVITNNQDKEIIKIFEIGNSYHKKNNDLPEERLMLTGIIKDKKSDEKIFKELKRVILDLFEDLGVQNFHFLNENDGDIGILMTTKTNFNLGIIKIIDEHIIAFELDLQQILHHATLKKLYTNQQISANC